ncbi:MAG: PEGA domain-containing protein [Acidobacteriota bacterium]|jgi:hypothetical protein|nr:PEGA domain-containing protein [Acidobacteriota bacterium]
MTMNASPRIVRLALAVILASHLCFGQAAQTSIPEGTRIKVRLEQSLSGDSAQEGQHVQLSVVDEVKVGDTVVIAQGANVTGQVTLAQPKRRMGRTGKIDFSIERVTAVDQSYIPLRYTANRTEGGSTAISTGVLTAGIAIVFFPAAPIALLRRGKEARIEAGTVFDVFTDQAHTLSVPAATADVAGARYAKLDVASTPAGADVELDGDFVGSTPLELELEAGAHEVVVKKKGFQPWRRSLKTSGATVRISADLEPDSAVAEDAPVASPAPAAPAAPSAAPAPPGLDGTRWTYSDSEEEYEIEFLQGGRLRVGQAADTTPDDDTWEAGGDAVTLYRNGRYVTQDGKIGGDGVIRGTAVNERGETWSFEMRRSEGGEGVASAHAATVSAPPSLGGTRWTYSDSDGEYEIEFLPDGRLRVHQTADTTPDDDTWEAGGDAVTLYRNDRYATYKGGFDGDGVIRGTAVNKKGKTWSFEMRRSGR